MPLSSVLLNSLACLVYVMDVLLRYGQNDVVTCPKPRRQQIR